MVGKSSIQLSKDHTPVDLQEQPLEMTCITPILAVLFKS
jgi:hypothetical protein